MKKIKSDKYKPESSIYRKFEMGLTRKVGLKRETGLRRLIELWGSGMIGRMMGKGLGSDKTSEKEAMLLKKWVNRTTKITLIKNSRNGKWEKIK